MYVSDRKVGSKASYCKQEEGGYRVHVASCTAKGRNAKTCIATQKVELEQKWKVRPEVSCACGGQQETARVKRVNNVLSHQICKEHTKSVDKSGTG